jgi:hypothetical protein
MLDHKVYNCIIKIFYMLFIHSYNGFVLFHESNSESYRFPNHVYRIFERDQADQKVACVQEVGDIAQLVLQNSYIIRNIFMNRRLILFSKRIEIYLRSTFATYAIPWRCILRLRDVSTANLWNRIIELICKCKLRY